VTRQQTQYNHINAPNNVDNNLEPRILQKNSIEFHQQRVPKQANQLISAQAKGKIAYIGTFKNAKP